MMEIVVRTLTRAAKQAGVPVVASRGEICISLPQTDSVLLHRSEANLHFPTMLSGIICKKIYNYTHIYIL